MIMNFVAVAIFFHTIRNAVFLALRTVRYGTRGLSRPISTYFGIVETNSHTMLHLHYLI